MSYLIQIKSKLQYVYENDLLHDKIKSIKSVI